MLTPIKSFKDAIFLRELPVLPPAWVRFLFSASHFKGAPNSFGIVASAGVSALILVLAQAVECASSLLFFCRYVLEHRSPASAGPGGRGGGRGKGEGAAARGVSPKVRDCFLGI